MKSAWRCFHRAVDTVSPDRRTSRMRICLRTRYRVRVASSGCACAWVGCCVKAGRAGQYRKGTLLSTLKSELGPPTIERSYSAEVDKICPEGTTRTVEYHGPWRPAFVHGAAIAFLCVDRTDKVLSVLFSDS